MKAYVRYIILAALLVMAGYTGSAQAQCAMCSLNAEQGVKNGNTTTKTINAGVLFLLAVPFSLAALAGSVWYYKYKPKAQ